LEESRADYARHLWEEVVASAFDDIDALSIPLQRAYAQAHLLAQLPADESPHAVGLPAGLTHQGLQTGSCGPFEQGDYLGGFGVFAALLAGGLLPRTTLLQPHRLALCGTAGLQVLYGLPKYALLRPADW